jgi:hypothetical protein
MTELEALLNARLRPLCIADYETLVASGAFEHQRVELLRGRVVWQPRESAAHTDAIEHWKLLLKETFGAVARVRAGLPLRTSDDSLPEPDLALTPKPSESAPYPSGAFLVIEVALVSLAEDRLVKAALYAEGRAPEYWVVNLQALQLEVFRAPKDGVYTERFVLGATDSIRPIAFPELSLPLAELLVPSPA